MAASIHDLMATHYLQSYLPLGPNTLASYLSALVQSSRAFPQYNPSDPTILELNASYLELLSIQLSHSPPELSHVLTLLHLWFTYSRPPNTASSSSLSLNNELEILDEICRYVVEGLKGLQGLCTGLVVGSSEERRAWEVGRKVLKGVCRVRGVVRRGLVFSGGGAWGDEGEEELSEMLGRIL